jgi:3-oxoadipate enol-lactonase
VTTSLLRLGRLASALSDVAPLARGLEPVPQVTAHTEAGRPGAEVAPEILREALRRVLDRLASRLDVRPLPVAVVPQGASPPGRPRAGELAISRHLRLGELCDAAQELAGLPDADYDEAAAGVLARRPARTVVHAWDGTPLACYSAGPSRAPVVVVVTACGMPVGLIDGWLSGLGGRFRVLTWESRGLFEDDGRFDERAWDLDAQARDLHAVLDAFGVEEAHVMGLCGGAPIALAAAGSPRVRSLSLWHGDYELGDEAPKTDHQKDVQELMVMAGATRARATSLQRMFERPRVLDKLPGDLAHHVMYPYANAELLYRYGRLNGAIMTTDCRPLLGGVSQPCLVITSESDTTAHPSGSVHVAGHLRRGLLRVMPRGDHLSAFGAAPELLALAEEFVADNF